MRVVIFSWYFPPINEIGAVRVGKIADYFHEQGHEVWAITAKREDADRSLALALPAERVIRTRWLDLDRLGSPWTWGARGKMTGSLRARPVEPAGEAPLTLRRRMGRHYMWLLRFPDRQGGWLPFLRGAAAKLLKARRFDLIYASGPSFTSFVVASQMSRRFGVPWIAEYRDGWSGDHHVPKPAWRERIDAALESRITRTAAGVVAVSEPWADYYVKRFGKPTVAAYNGFDPVQRLLAASDGSSGLPVRIVHMGTIYRGLRDPSVLFDAITGASLSPAELQVDFYGAEPSTILPLAKQKGVDALVRVLPRVSYDSALDIQRRSDVLLLLQSPFDIGNVPAKTFEYFAARRPILGLGLDEGIPARLVRERNAGLYCTSADAVTAQLRSWVEQKRRHGVIKALPESVCEGLSRTEQLARLEAFALPLARASAPDARADRAPQPASVRAPRPQSVPLSSMLPESPSSIVRFEAAEKPRLLAIIDAEEEFDWSKPFSAAATAVTTMKLQERAQKLFMRFGVTPTYAVDYVVADREEGYRPLLDFLKSGACEIGAQLHPWVTPPHGEEIGERFSFPGNLPSELELKKLENLTARIEANFGTRPRLYRAGRYGAGPNTAAILRLLKYRIDCSVLPPGQRNSVYSPDYSGAPVSPYWIGGGTDLLEIPVTKSTIGFARSAHDQLAPYLFSWAGLGLRLPGVMARLRLLDHIRLSPEGTTLDEAKRLTRFLLARGERVFVVSYHTPSLGIGHTPYVRSPSDLHRFFSWLEGYLEFFFGEISGIPSTPNQIRNFALRNVGTATEAYIGKATVSA